MSNFYIVGSKYGDRADGFEDIFPQLVSRSIVAVGFAAGIDLSSYLGKDESTIASFLASQGENSDSQNSLRLFLNIAPGDMIAVKKHSSPRGHQAQLVISGYAIVEGKSQPVYSHDKHLGHTIAVTFVEVDEITFPFGYGKTIHRIDDATRVSAIFGNYGAASSAVPTINPGITKKTNVSPSQVGSRAGYTMFKTHNLMQNALYKDLVSMYGKSSVKMEHEYVDLLVETKTVFILFEIKTHMSVKYCVREAIGQLLHYDWKLSRAMQTELVVVGPSEASTEDLDFLKSVQSRLNIVLRYVRKGL